MVTPIRYFFCFLIVIFLSTHAHAITLLDTFGFTRISNNSAEDIASQLSVELWDLENGQVRFDFRNNVGVNSSVSEIYYDDGSLLSLDSIINDPSFTSFAGGSANPGNLPNGETLTPPFQAVSSLSADAQGNPANGLDQNSEVFQMIFSLQAGQSPGDVQDAIASGALRIGLHVRSIGAGQNSDAFVNLGGPPAHVIPEPSTLLLLGLGLVLVSGIGQIRKLQKRS